jgi:hypothetical protein
MRTSDMVKSKYWRGKDLQGRPPVTLTIIEVTEELFTRGGKNEVKCCMWFREDLKGVQLNKTRVALLEYAYGPDSDLWIGRRVRLSYDPTVMFGDKPVGGVKLETPPSAIYGGPVAGVAPTAIPPGAPPRPYWDGKAWVFPATPATNQPPPPPVWNAATNSWDLVNPNTGEIQQAGSAQAQPVPQPHTPPPTISQRIAAGSAPTSDWGPDYQALSKPGQDFDDDIPF